MRPSKGFTDIGINYAHLRCGVRVWLFGEKRPYTVMAKNKHLVACVKPFTVRKTYIYTILDIKRGYRGTDGFVLGLSWKNRTSCVDSLKVMHKYGGEVSQRNRVALSVVRMAKPMKSTPLPDYSHLNRDLD